ncbi:MAG: UDP-N-acetylmuramate: L-alanyl-gamma-D-glutamyl-meso-diaminopimelate ligase [Bacteroidota bacterium]|nr:UDP-N-acetylmuramate: L-alanyl-gamma-D-glutamyl-meso-diaminopimelate ligase [Bacteroidota bacterium]
MRVHFIAIGGAVMHNLAIALHRKGYKVTGSDDEIFEPSGSRLEQYGLLPAAQGWDASCITNKIDTIILGMHASEDNPELIRARELGIRIMSFPEYIYEQTKNKKRIVVAGSHGKTTTTAIIMHVFKFLGIRFDYMVGSSIDGYETMVGLSDDSEIAVLEGDEYLTSAIDKRPKFHLYMPDIAIINGIAWDHMNVFPTYENYIDQFRIFIEKITEGGCLIYFDGDPLVKELVLASEKSIRKIPYKVHGYFQNKTGFFAATHNRVVPVKIFGEHNMQNLSAAKEACIASGVSEDDFYEAVQSFEGTSKRLQKLNENEKGVVYLDFAHSPSKVKATVEAIVSRYPGRDIVAALELHTYSSLSSGFLPLYDGTLEKATTALVYFNPHTIILKRLPDLSAEDVRKAFGKGNIKVYDYSAEMFSFIRQQNFNNPVYLFMSSGDFDGCNIKSLSEELLRIK